MSQTQNISVLLILVGLVLPIISLGFVSEYHPALGFVGNIARMKIVLYKEDIQLSPTPPVTSKTSVAEILRNSRSRMEEYARKKQQATEVALPYGLIFALGCLLISAGGVDLLFYSDQPEKGRKKPRRFRPFCKKNPRILDIH